MANGKLVRIMAMMAGIAMLGLFTITAMAADVPRITVEDLKAQFDSNDMIIVDVRSNKSWEKSDFMIKGAIRVEPNPKNMISWASKHKKDQKIVLYCT